MIDKTNTRMIQSEPWSLLYTNASGDISNISLSNQTGYFKINGEAEPTIEEPAGGNSYIVKTANYTAVAGDRIAADTTGGAFTITLPASPAAGDVVEIVPIGTFATNNLTVGRNGENIDGAASNAVLDYYEGASFVYISGYGWLKYVLRNNRSFLRVEQAPFGQSTLTHNRLTVLYIQGTGGSGGEVLVGDYYGGNTFLSLGGGVGMNRIALLRWGANDGATSGYDVGMHRKAAGIIGVTDGSNDNSGGGALAFIQRSAPAAQTNAAMIYAKDVSGTAEMFVMDEAGNETQISPHAHHAPDSIRDSSFDDIGYSANYYTAIITWTNRARETAGRANARIYETFAEYNARLNLAGDAAMTQWDWDTVQAGHVAKREQERTAWAERKAAWEAEPQNEGKEFTEPEPPVLTAKPIPSWLQEQLDNRETFLAQRTSRSVLYPDAEMYQVHDWMIDNDLNPENVPTIINGAFQDVKERKKALARWNKAVRVPRDFPLVNVIGSLMGLTPEQIDEAWSAIIAR